MLRYLAAALLCAGAHAAAPFAGQLDYHAQRELDRWQPLVTISAGASIGAEHDEAAGRTVGVFRSAQDPGAATLRYGLRQIRTGQTNSFSDSDTETASFRVRLRMRASGSGVDSFSGSLLALDASAAEPFVLLGVDASGRLEARLAGEVVITGPVMTDQWCEIGLTYIAATVGGAQDGELRLSVDGEPIGEAPVEHSVVSQVSGFVVGIGAGGAPGEGEVRAAWVVWSDRAEEELSHDPWLGAVNLRDADQTRARIVVQQDPAMLGWSEVGARALYSAGGPGDWPGDAHAQTTQRVGLDESNGWTGTVGIDTLTPGSAWSYRIEFDDGAGGTIVTPVWTFRTLLASSARSTDLEFWLRYCTDHNGGSHPMVGDRLIAQAASEHALILQLGDYAYNETRDGPPWDATPAGIVDTLRCTALSPDHNLVSRRFPQFFVRSDHDGWENNARPDLYENSELPPATGEFTGITTRAELWENGLAAWNAWACDAMLNQHRPDEDFRSFEVGDALLLFLDTRSSWSAGTILGNGPGSQFEIAKDILATTERSLVILAMDSPMGDIQVGGDNWQARPGYRAQRKEILDTLQANPNVKGALVLAGDRHAAVLHSRLTIAQGANWPGWPKVRFEFFPGPHSNNVFQQYDFGEESLPGVHLSTTNGADPLAGPPEYARMIGRVNIDETKGIVRFRVYDADPGDEIAAQRILFDESFGLYAIDPGCPADVNRDGLVTFGDLQVVLAEFAQVGAMMSGDRNADGEVDFEDLNIVLSAFGEACDGPE